MTRISIQSAKAKGRNLQKWVCKQISNLTGIPWGSEDDKLIQSRPMGQSGSDVVLREGALKAFPYSVECKSAETFNLVKTVEQAKQNMYPNTDWLIVYKRKSFKQPVVILESEVFFNLLKKEKLYEYFILSK